MKLFLYALLVIVAGCSATTEEKVTSNQKSVMIFGDSWAYLTYFHKVSENKGYAINSLTKSGSTANYWASDEGKTIINAYCSLKTSDYVILSLGGNDLIADYNTVNSEDRNAEMLAELVANIEEVYLYLKAQMPYAKIIILGLDYPNFKESRESLIPNVANSYWEKTGKPTAYQINSVLIKFYSELKKVVSEYEDLQYSENLGLMQHTENNALPFPYGDPSSDSPAEYMERGEIISSLIPEFVYTDSIHLNKAGYQIVIDRLFENFIND